MKDQDDNVKKQKSSKNKLVLKFKCPQCERKFAYKGNLTGHLKDHEKGTDNKPETTSENPTIEYITNAPGAVGYSGSTETLPHFDYITNPPGAVGYSGSPEVPPLTSGFFLNGICVNERMQRENEIITQQDPYVQQTPNRPSSFIERNKPNKL